MGKICYPFAAVPNQVLRGGHGALNIAVLAVLLSHGRTTASVSTIAREIGCDRKSVLPAIRYWKENGPTFGIEIQLKGGGQKTGTPTIYEVVIHKMETPTPENGRGGGPKTGQGGGPKTGHKEEPLRKTHKNIPVREILFGDKYGRPDRITTGRFEPIGEIIRGKGGDDS